MHWGCRNKRSFCLKKKCKKITTNGEGKSGENERFSRLHSRNIYMCIENQVYACACISDEGGNHSNFVEFSLRAKVFAATQ